jgi:hypothetical protein
MFARGSVLPCPLVGAHLQCGAILALSFQPRHAITAIAVAIADLWIDTGGVVPTGRDR